MDADWDQDEEWVRQVRARLIAWYAAYGRRLPWRERVDAYRVLVSEAMLVQTTAKVVAAYFERFLQRFPDFESLAAASGEEVVKAWEGLGYYRRARQLHEAAQVVVREHRGQLPADEAVISRLPGVGRYMTGAILSFAFDRAWPIVEANSQRLLARLLAVRGDISRSSPRERLWEAAARLVDPDTPGLFNQGLIDLGALICTPRQPRCLICPLEAHCQARKLGLVDVLPQVRPRLEPLASSEACAVVEARGRLLVVRRAAGGLWAGFWEFPTINLDGADPGGRSFGAPVDLAEGVERLTGIQARLGPAEKTVRYSVTRHRVTLSVHRGRALGGRLRPGPGLVDARWITPHKLFELTLSSAGRKLANWIANGPEPA